MKTTSKKTSRIEQIWRVSTVGLFVSAGIVYAVVSSAKDWIKCRWFENFGNGENY